jgi:hypothetical protein
VSFLFVALNANLITSFLGLFLLIARLLIPQKLTAKTQQQITFNFRAERLFFFIQIPDRRSGKCGILS